MDICRKSLIIIFKLYNLSCITFDGKIARSSKLWAMKNVLITPALFLFRIISTDFIAKGFDTDVGNVKHLSLFFMFAFSFMMMIYIYITWFCIFVQWLRRRTIESFVNKCIEFKTKFLCGRNQSCEAAEKKLFKNMAALFVLLIYLSIHEFYTMMKFNFEGFILFVLYQNDGFICLVFFGYIHCFLFYLTFLLKNLNQELELQDSISTNLVKVSDYIKEVRTLIEGFHESFGLTLSVVVILVIVTNVLRVRN